MRAPPPKMTARPGRGGAKKPAYVEMSDFEDDD